MSLTDALQVEQRPARALLRAMSGELEAGGSQSDAGQRACGPRPLTNMSASL